MKEAFATPHGHVRVTVENATCEAEQRNNEQSHVHVGEQGAKPAGQHENHRKNHDERTDDPGAGRDGRFVGTLAEAQPIGTAKKIGHQVHRQVVLVMISWTEWGAREGQRSNDRLKCQVLGEVSQEERRNQQLDVSEGGQPFAESGRGGRVFFVGA